MLRGAKPARTRGTQAPPAGLVQWHAVNRQRNFHRCSAANGTRVDHAATNVQQSDNLVVASIVSAMTESLRLLGIGKRQYEHISRQAPINSPLQPGDIAGMMSRIQGDFQQAYFVTGVIDDSIYDPNCTFADPTVKFSGLDLWKRNLQLLVPFLIQPEIRLISINQTESSSEGTRRLQAQWTLQTTLALPWQPFIDVLGSTVYTLNSDANKVVLHVESWNITALQALQQVFTPGDGRRSQRSQQNTDSFGR